MKPRRTLLPSLPSDAALPRPPRTPQIAASRACLAACAALFWIVALRPGCAFAADPFAFQDLQAASPAGRYLVIVRADRSFEVYERADAGRSIGAQSRPGPGDRFLRKGVLPQLPRILFVGDDGGFVAFENEAHGPHGYRFAQGFAVVVIGPDGVERGRARLNELFGAKIRKRFVHGIWQRACWIDERRRAFLVLAEDGSLRAVSLENGAISAPSPLVLIDQAFFGEDLRTREFALDAVVGLGRGDFAPFYEAMVRTASFPVSLRLRAAMGSASLCADPQVRRLFRECSCAASEPNVQLYSLWCLPEILGEEALPFLREALKAHPSMGRSAQPTLERLGLPAVPLLCSMVADRSQSVEYRTGAAAALAKIGSPTATAALLHAVPDFRDVYFFGGYVLNDAIRCGGPELRPGLVRLLQEGVAQDDQIADYFAEHPGPDMVPALTAAIERWSGPAPKDREKTYSFLPELTQREVLIHLRAALAATQGARFDVDRDTMQLFLHPNEPTQVESWRPQEPPPARRRS